MSQLSIRNSLLNQAVTTLTPIVDGIAYQNSDFNPAGLDSWASFAFVPATSESLGKSVLSTDDSRGFIQINVYIKTNAVNYDNQQLSIIDAIYQDFYYSKVIDDVYIMEVTTATGFTTESWFTRVVTINYSAYQGRG